VRQQAVSSFSSFANQGKHAHPTACRPPGTGKTKTIGGLVGKFLSDRPSPTTAIHAPGSKPPLKALQNDADPVKKILICAPSNAAIDEVTKRLKEGVLSSSGQLIRPKIVRIGGMESINIAVKDVSLDELVDQKLQGSSALNSTDGAADLARIRAELDAIRTAKDQKLAEIQKATDPTTRQQLEEETRKLSHKRHTLTHQLNKAKDESKDRNRSLDAARRKARQDVVFEADIICSTLSGAGHDLLSSFNFETVIIDEAAQAVELSALIPLKYQCKRCIMVGGA
jgi:senataxin